MKPKETTKTEQDNALSQDQITQLTQETAKAVMELEISKDIETGKVINSCIQKMPVNPNNYNYLAEQCNAQEFDLRHKVANYRLWKQMGESEGLKDIPIGILSIALSKKIPEFQKRKHILFAQNNHLSCSAFWDYLADKMINYKPAPKPKSFKHYLTLLVDYVSNGSCGKLIRKTPALQDLLVNFINKVIIFQLVPVEKINLPIKTNHSEDLTQHNAA